MFLCLHKAIWLFVSSPSMYPILGALICKDSRVATLNVESTRWGLGRLQSNECSSSERTFESEFSDLFSISRSAPAGSVHTNAQSLLCHWKHGSMSFLTFLFNSYLYEFFHTSCTFRIILKVCGCIGSQTRNESMA